MTASVFVDSNVLVYWLDATEPDKQRDAEAWLRHLWTSRAGRISYQILIEFYVTLLEPLRYALRSLESGLSMRTHDDHRQGLPGGAQGDHSILRASTGAIFLPVKRSGSP